MRIELRLEAEPWPRAVLVALPGQKIRLKLPIPPPAIRHSSVLLRVQADCGFIPNDYHPGPGGDTRLLSLKLHAVRAGPISGEAPAALLQRLAGSLAAL